MVRSASLARVRGHAPVPGRPAVAVGARLTRPGPMPVPVLWLAAVDGVPGLVAPAPTRINPTQRTLRFIVPVTDGPTYLGDVELAVSPKDELSVVAPRLLQLLEPLLKEVRFVAVQRALGPAPELTEAMLTAAGVKLRYDSAKLALALDLPVEARRGRSFSLRSGKGSQSETLRPAGISGYLNLRSSFDAVEQGPNRGLLAPVSLAEGAVRIAGIVAESAAFLSLRPDEPRVRRTFSRLVYDDLKHVMRITAGDITPASRAFQSSPLIGGISVSRFYNILDPQRDVRSGGVQNFAIVSPSVVETFVNGRSVERKSLQPGTYTLSDFPLAEGANDVRLEIEDAAGQRRNVNFNLYSNLALLEPGLTEFSAYAGVYALPTRSGLAYSRHWASAGFVRRGLSSQVTAGLNAQVDREAAQIGGDLLFGNSLGLIGFSLAGSRRSAGGNGFVGAIDFQRVIDSSNGGTSQSIHASAEYRSAHFAIPGALTSIERQSLRAAAGYTLTFGQDKFASADVQFARDRVLRRNSVGARGTLGWRIGPSMGAIAEVKWEHGGERRGLVLQLGLRRRFGERGSARADADSRGGASIAFQDSGGAGVGAWAGDVDLSRDRHHANLDLNGSYLANRAEIGFQQSLTVDGSGQRLSDARSSLRVGTSIAFADGAVAIGRPISDAFLIASPHRSLKGSAVRLDPYERSEAAHSGRLGPALEGALGSYSTRTLVYDVPGAPAGYDLGQGNVQLIPPYRAGYKLEIGSDYHLLVIGRLLDGEGQPVSLLAGKAIDLGAPKHAALTIFTARNGKFGAQGLRPGKWRIEMPSEPPTAYEFEVHDSADGTVRVGDLRPVDATKKDRQ